jgi:hypothetical protein
MATRRALLLIADIGGSTEYMQAHRSILGHAEAVTTRNARQGGRCGARRIGGTLGMVGRGLPYILRRRRPRDTASAY